MASTFPTTPDNFQTNHQDGVNEVIDALDINNLADAHNKVQPWILAANRRIYSVEQTPYNAVADFHGMDGSATNASTTFTSATANFTGADVGKWIVISNVEFASAEHDLHATISSVTNSTTVVLSRQASRTRSGLRFWISRGGDSTTAIQSAIDAAHAAGGGEVHLSGAGYLVTGLVLKHRVWLRGRGLRGTLLHQAGSSAMPVIRNDITSGNNAAYVKVSDMTIDGNAYHQANPTTTLAAGYTAGNGSVTIASATGWLFAGAFKIGTNRFVFGERVGTTLNYVNGGVEHTTDANASSGATVTYYANMGITFQTDPINTHGTLAETFEPQQRIENVMIRNTLAEGIALYGMSGTRVNNCNIWNTWEGGLRTSWDTWINDTDVANAGFWGFYSRQSEVRYTNCKAWQNGSFDGTKGHGFLIEGLTSLEEGCYQLLACNAQDNRANGFRFVNAQRVIADITSSSNSRNSVGGFAGLYVAGCTNGSIRCATTERMYDQVNSFQQNALEIQDTAIITQGMDIWVSHGLSYTATVGTAIKSGSTISTGNNIRINSQGATLVGAFSATYTADPYLAKTHQVTQTGNITIAAPSNAHLGCELRFVLIQDATGGRTITFNAALPANWAPSLLPNSTNIIEFVHNGTAWVQTSPAADVPKTVELRADVASAAVTTFADVTGLSFAVVSGQNYRFQAYLLYTTSAATIGVRAAVAAPAFTHLAYHTRTGLGTTGSSTNMWMNSQTAVDSGTASTSSVSTTGGNLIILEGVIRPSANGTVQVRFAPETATLNGVIIEAGSTLTWW